MGLRPIEKMLEAVDIARSDSDISLFFELMYLGEMLTKTVATALVAAVLDDRDRHRYRQVHRLVRADSLGEWVAVVDHVLAGPASQFLTPRARDIQRELTQLVGPGAWQYEASYLLYGCLKLVDPGTEPLTARVDGRRSFAFFVALRNKTRGHGATQGETCGRLCAPLERALRLLINNLSVLQLEWTYLHRNLSGKYRVTPLGGQGTSFEYLKKTTNESWPNGVYVFLDRPARVDLMEEWVPDQLCRRSSKVGYGLENGPITINLHDHVQEILDILLLADSLRLFLSVLCLPVECIEGDPIEDEPPIEVRSRDCLRSSDPRVRTIGPEPMTLGSRRAGGACRLGALTVT